MEYAILEIAGKQYKVEAGKPVRVDKLNADGDTVTLDKVIMYNDGSKTTVGAPYVTNMSVIAKVLGDEKGKKIHVLRFRAKSHYHKARGHRTQYTKILVESFGNGSQKNAAKAD